MARYAGLMPRFASTRPNAQSAICAPPVNQSSVHEKTKHPGRARLEAGAHHHRHQLGLVLLALPDRVDAELGEDERLVLGDVLQPAEIAAEGLLAVQVDVERDEVEELRQVEVLGGREVGVAHQRARGFAA